MTATTTTTARRPAGTVPARTHHLASRLLGAALALAVAYVHVKDQGGFPGDKEPSYIGLGYYLLEATAVVLAVGLVVGPGRHRLKTWALTVGLAIGPLAGYVLSRGPGLPDYSDDQGNWTEPLVVVSVVVELALLAVAAGALAGARRRRLQLR